nr:hypothetical protein [Tanacetum cinerariifolium]
MYGVIVVISRALFGYSTFGAILLLVLLGAYLYGFLYLSVVWQLASVVTVLEDLNGFNAMKKGKVLLYGKKKDGMGLAFVMYFLLIGLMIVLELFVEYGDELCFCCFRVSTALRRTWGASISGVSLKSAFRAEGPVGLLGWLALDSSGKSASSFSCWLLIWSSGCPSLMGEVLDKAGLGVSVNITALGSSVDIGSGSCRWSQNGIGRCEWYLLILLESMEGGKDFCQKIVACDVNRARCKTDLDVVDYQCSKQEWCGPVVDIYMVNCFWYVRIEIVNVGSLKFGKCTVKVSDPTGTTTMTAGFSIVSYSIEGQRHFMPKYQLDDVSTVKSKVYI